MLLTLAPVVVLLVGLYLVALAAAAILVPARASRFLGGLAQSPSRHYTELALRLLAGGALIVQAPRMHFTTAVALFGWLLVGTTGLLLLMPWAWHRRFAQRVVPTAVTHLRWLAVGALGLGAAVLASLGRSAA